MDSDVLMFSLDEWNKKEDKMGYLRDGKALYGLFYAEKMTKSI